MPASAIAAHLEHVLREEGLGADPAALRLIAHAARGSMRDALSLADQAIAYASGNLTESDVRGMLGTADAGHLIDLLEALARRDTMAVLSAADAMEARSVSFDSALAELARLLHRVALAQSIPAALAEDTPERERIVALAQALDPEDVQLNYQIALHGRQDLPLAPDEYAGFTMTLMRMLAFAPEGPGDVAARPSAQSTPAPIGSPNFGGEWPRIAREAQGDRRCETTCRAKRVCRIRSRSN